MILLSEEEKIRQELNQMLKKEWKEHYDYVVDVLTKKGYDKETVRKVLDEEIIRLERGSPKLRAKELAGLVVARNVELSSNPNSKNKKDPPQIYLDEMEKNIDLIIEEEARALYRKETRRRPPKEIPQQYYDKAMISILKRWQKTFREIEATVPKMAPPPPTEPVELAKEEVIAKGPPLCPICGEPMKRIVGNLYQCPKHPSQTMRKPEV